jgi:hypothetical protein
VLTEAAHFGDKRRSVAFVFPVIHVGPIMLFLAAAAGHGKPWEARKPPVLPANTHELATPDRWPAEPAQPEPIDPARFRESLGYLCSKPADQVPADDLLAAAKDAQVDPFLLGALVREESRCDGKRRNKRGFGLLAIHPGLYQSEGAPPLPVDAKLLTATALKDDKTNLTVGAKLLRMWQDAHAELDESFGGAAHRTGVAHFFWGDQVRHAGNEDLVLTARRRFVARYLNPADAPQTTSLGIPFVCPLEGKPRVASSGPGEDRDGGLRRHRGLDIAASEGEPVRAVADGKVLFAGVNLRNAPRKGPIPPSKIARYRNRSLGAGGIYLCIRHDLPADAKCNEVVTCYMHLSSYVVAAEDKVTAGQTIGFVGRTGVRVSPPHLHMEVRVDDHAKNPARYLTADVFPPKTTKTYRAVAKAKRARVKAARAAAATPTTGG